MPPTAHTNSVLVLAAAAISSLVTYIVVQARGQKQQQSRRLLKAKRGLTRAQVLANRRTHLAGNLSLTRADNPLWIVRGEGCYLYEEDGRAILDCVNNVACLGHSHPALDLVAYGQLHLVNTNTRYLDATRGIYAKKLLATLPAPLCDGVVYFVNSGSEANDLALRLARTYTKGALDTIVLGGAYHGHTSSLIEVSPYKYEGTGGSGVPEPHIHKAPIPDVYRGMYRAMYPEDEGNAGQLYGETIREICGYITGQEGEGGGEGEGEGEEKGEETKKKKKKKRVGAFIAESVLGCGGQIVLPPGYLSAAYSYVRAAGGVCIADEVQVGFGRVGTHFWGFETQEVVPDIVTMGKPMGNGFPIGAVVARREIAEAFTQNGMEYFNTFGASNLSVAIGEAVLDTIHTENLQAHAHEAGTYLLHQLHLLQARHSEVIGHVRGLGLFLGIELVEDPRSRTPSERAATWVARRCLEMNVQISTDGPQHNVLKIKPPLCFGTKEADELVRVLDVVLAQWELSLYQEVV